jgi:hypothetical protein
MWLEELHNLKNAITSSGFVTPALKFIAQRVNQLGYRESPIALYIKLKSTLTKQK